MSIKIIPAIKTITRNLASYRLPDWLRIIALALAYLLLAEATLKFSPGDGMTSVIWPPSGLALAALLIGGKKYWPGVFIGALTLNLLQGNSAPVSAFIALSCTLEAVTGAWLLTAMRVNPMLSRLRDYLLLGLVEIISAAVGAAIGVTTLWVSGLLTQQQFTYHLLLWWQGDMMGMVLLVSLLLIWHRAPRSWSWRERIIESIAFFGLAFLTGQVIFMGWFHEILGNYAEWFLMFIFIGWGALRFGRHGVLMIFGMTTIQALLGPTLREGHITPAALISLWFYILEMKLIGMTIAMNLDERRQLEQEQARQILHLDVMERIGRISNTTDNVEEMLGRVLDEILRIFDADRAWFFYPCDPDADFWYVPMERTHPEWPGAFALGEELPMTPEVARLLREMLAAKGTVQHGPLAAHPVPAELARQFSIQSQLQVVLRPKIGRPWLLGLHHCARAHLHSDAELQIFDAIAQRVADSLSSIITLKTLRDSERKFRYMLETSPIAVRIAAAGGHKVLFANDRYAKLIGADRDQVIGTDPTTNYANPQDYQEILDQLAQGKSITNKLIQHNVGGRTSWVLASLLNIEYENMPAVLGWFYDVTELRNANEDQQLASLVYQNSSQAMMVTDADSTIITINPAFTETTGYTLEEVVGKSTRILSSGRQDQAFFRNMWDALITTGHWQGEIWNRRKSGELYAEWLTINTIFREDGSVHRRVALFSDITQKKQAEELIWQQANFDPLTQLPNRRMFHDRLEQEIKKAHRTSSSMALMFIDLDHFKEVNDTLGHSMGDTLLLEVAMRIMACVRETDTVARLGGDEFTVILGELVDLTSIERITQNILQSLSAPFQLGNEKAYISASIGITLYPSDATTKEALLKNADQAMYAAKNQGRNQHCYFTPSMQENSLHKMRLANDLRTALADRQFWLAYQPIVNLNTGAIYKAEALIRWQHPHLGLIGPAAFIPLAEEIKLINDIGDWIFEEALQQTARWRTRYQPEFQISINKSPVQFHRDSSNHSDWLNLLKTLELPGQSVVIEITEGLILEVSPIVSDKLLEYRDAGVQIAIDDFGTGYSALSYLKKFDIDYLKIDQSFVRNLAPDSSDMALCEAIIVMAHRLGLKVIAEGVETEAQRDLLKAAGCDYGQGYLFSRPVPAIEFEKLF